MYVVEVKKKAKKETAALPKKDRQRIIAAGPVHTFSLMEKTLRNQAEAPKKALISGVRTSRRPGRAANTVLPEQSRNHLNASNLPLLVEATFQKSFDANT